MTEKPRKQVGFDDFDQWRYANPQPQPNMPLLRKVLAELDSKPEMWDQSEWGSFEKQVNGEYDCGTPRCVAGWAATFAEVLVVSYDGEVSVPGTAIMALGLTHAETGLFLNRADLTRDKERKYVQAYAERIAARAGEVL